MDIDKRKLFRRYIDNLYSTNDARELLDAVRHSGNKEVFDSLADDVWEEAALQNTLTGVEFERNKKEAHSLLNRMKRRNVNWFRRVAVPIASVAAICLLVVGSVSVWNYLNECQVVYKIATTSYGETKELILADSTVIVLNSCSKARFPDRFLSDERRIELEGEGYFQVHRNEEKPFIVHTSRFDIRVLGTSFNVRSYGTDELVSVNVESGKVQVDMPEAMMRLKEKEQVQINTLTGNYAKGCVEKEVAQWRKGTLCFFETPIRDVAKELERIYHCVITFSSDQNFNNLISGEHDNVSLEAVLRSIEYTTGIHFEKNGNEIRMYK